MGKGKTFSGLGIGVVLSTVAGIFLALYVAANLVSSLIAASKRGIRYLLVLPLIYLTIHFGLAWGFINEAFRSFRR